MLQNLAPLSVWPPDDNRKGLEDALKGRPHVARAEGVVTSSAAASFEAEPQTVS